MNLLNSIAEGISDLVKFIISGIKGLMALSLILLIVAAILFALYWVGKAVFGFIKYYSQFA